MFLIPCNTSGHPQVNINMAENSRNPSYSVLKSLEILYN